MKQELIEKLYQAYKLVQEVHTSIEHIPDIAKKHLHTDSEIMDFIYSIEDTNWKEFE